MSEERRPLLNSESEIAPLTTSGRATVITVRPINSDDLPAISVASDGSGAPLTVCQVCGASMNLEGKLNQHVVKCSQCTEANPIKPPPLGKKYVRCPCNCLLICKQTSQRIACPRRNCNRVMQVRDGDESGTMPNIGFVGGMTTSGYSSGNSTLMSGASNASSPAMFRARVLCAYCSEPFTAEASHLSVHEMIYVRCPQCSRRSFLNSYYRFKRMLAWYTVALLLVITGFIVLGVLHSELASPGAIIGCLLPLILGGACLSVAVYFTCLKVSEIM